MNGFKDQISDIIVKTCLVNPLGNPDYDLGFRLATNLARHMSSGNMFQSGSTTEFYIVPPVKCVGDSDLMMSSPDIFVSFDQSAQYSHVGDTISEMIYVYQIDDRAGTCPIGYYYLQEYNIQFFNYVTGEFEPFRNNKIVCHLEHVLFPDPGFGWSRSGPATIASATAANSGTSFLCPSIKTHDMVFCIRCLTWPPAAQSWLHRPRKHGWPNAAVMSDVMKIGCYLVPVSHRDYKGQ